ncbi:hypothetical protein FOZ61_001534, partial [Perkinsus olseni]
HQKFGAMIFVDDGLLLLQQEFYVIGVIVFLLLWVVLAFLISWPKCVFDGDFVRVHPDIFASIRDILLSFVDKGKVYPVPLAKVRFWLGIAENPSPHLASSLLRPLSGDIVAASDASVNHMAGWVSDGTSGIWFAFPTTSDTLGPWVKHLYDSEHLVPCHRDISLFELLATSYTLYLVEIYFFRNNISKRVSLFCDNQGVVGMLRKRYSAKSAMAEVMRYFATLLARLDDSISIIYISSADNWLADSLSRGVVPALPSCRAPVGPSFAGSRKASRKDVFNLLQSIPHDDARRSAQAFASTGLAPKTNELYDRTVSFFVSVIGRSTFPLRVEDLQLFVWALTQCNYAFKSINTFVSALRSRNKSHGHSSSPSDSLRVKHLLHAAEKACYDRPVRKMKPITRSDLFNVFRQCSPLKDWASTAMLLGIFSLLRADELLALRWSDVSVSDRQGVPVLSLAIRRSKTDQVGVGQLAFAACTASAVPALDPADRGSVPCEFCPCHAVLRCRPPNPCDDLVFPFTYGEFMDKVRARLGPVVGFDAVDEIGTHTLRRTGAQLLHRHWPAESPAFMRAGRWRSMSVLEYLHDSSEDKAKLAALYIVKDAPAPDGP